MDKCCGTCKFNDYIPFSDFICDNPDSDNYGLETEYKDSCEGWEEK